VKLEDDLEGLLHVSELSDHKISSPEEIVKPGQKIEVRVIRVDIEERKIGLSYVHADFEENKAILAEHERRRIEEEANPKPVEAEAGTEENGEAEEASPAEETTA
jgi:small subunit ribosomal protein S1